MKQILLIIFTLLITSCNELFSPRIENGFYIVNIDVLDKFEDKIQIISCNGGIFNNRGSIFIHANHVDFSIGDTLILTKK